MSMNMVFQFIHPVRTALIADANKRLFGVLRACLSPLVHETLVISKSAAECNACVSAYARRTLAQAGCRSRWKSKVSVFSLLSALLLANVSSLLFPISTSIVTKSILHEFESLDECRLAEVEFGWKQAALLSSLNKAISQRSVFNEFYCRAEFAARVSSVVVFAVCIKY